jgi:hypothetical protein
MERKRSKKPKASTSVKKKRSAGRRTKVEKDVAEQVPKPFKVADIIDVPTEAQNFNVALERAEEIAKDVERSEPLLTVTKTVDEQHFRERLEAALTNELAQRNVCGWPGCAKELGVDIVEAGAHIRWHMMTQADDPKLARAVWLDVEERLYPLGSASIHGKVALPPEEREKLTRLREERLRLLRTNVP